MAEKRFYWLKLKENYLSEPKIKKLRKIAGGDTYTIIYLKMQLLSIKNGGIVQFEGIEPTFEEELALKLDEDLDNVAITLNYLMMQGLVEENNKDYLFIEASNNVGSECQSAERVRRFREKENREMLQCNDSVTEVKRNSISISNSNSNSISNDIIEKENNTKEKEVKHKYGEYKNVLLTDNELEKIKCQYPNWEELIQFLDEAIEMKGYKYKSHYLAIKKWVVDAVNKKQPKVNKQEQSYEEHLQEMYNSILNTDFGD